MSRKYFIAWNEDRSEGFITNDKLDAQTARTGKPVRAKHRGYPYSSTVADAFYNAYEGDTFPPIEAVELPEITGNHTVEPSAAA